MKASIAVAGALLALAGCGGGGGSAPENPAPQPRVWGQRDATYGADGVAAGVSLAGHIPMGRFAFTRDGSAYILPNNYAVKLDPRGQVVPTFGVGGQASFPDRYSETRSPVVDDAGNLYVPMGFGAIKIRPDGARALEYGEQGIAYTPLPSGSPWMKSIALDGAGALHAAGDTSVARFDAQGRLSTAFGVNGVRSLDLGLHGALFDVKVDRQGNTYLAGRTDANGAVVVKLDPAGNLATGFGTGGVWSGACGGYARALALLATGEIVVAANCDPGGTGLAGSAHIFKVDARGMTVDDYREGGRRPMLFGTSEGYVESVLALPGGEVVIAGYRPKPAEQASGCFYSAAVAKLDARGNAVASANGASFVLLESEFATDVGTDADGWIYVGTMRRNSCASHPPAGSIAAVYKLAP